MKPAMAVDTLTCVGCGACVIACNTHYGLDPEKSRSWVAESVRGQYPEVQLEFRSERCMHCENPPCVHNCPTDASFIDENGLVMIDDRKCIGCGACVESCPYGARSFKQNGHISKCTLCNELGNDRDHTICSDACPTKSIVFGDLEDSQGDLVKLLKKREWKRLKEFAGTKPKLYYLT